MISLIVCFWKIPKKQDYMPFDKWFKLSERESMNYEYDEEYEYYVCTKNLDEDEMYRFVRGDFRDCPYYQFGDEYQIVRKQM